MEIFNAITPYHWAALGLILLTAEMLGAAGFLIGAAVAAFAMAALTFMVGDLGGIAQLTLYSISAIVATTVYFRVFRDAQIAAQPNELNQVTDRLIGHTFELDQDIGAGNQKIQIGDTLWRVRCDEALPKGALVEVIEARKMSLVIAAK